MKKKKLTYNSLALGNLKNRKKQYTLLIIGIILSMTLSSSFTFFVSSAISSALETHNFLYGKQTDIMLNTATSDEIEQYCADLGMEHAEIIEHYNQCMYNGMTQTEAYASTMEKLNEVLQKRAEAEKKAQAEDLFAIYDEDLAA